MTLVKDYNWQAQTDAIRSVYSTAVLLNISIQNLSARCLYQIDKLLNPSEKPIMRMTPTDEERVNDVLLNQYIKRMDSKNEVTVENLQKVYDAHIIPLQIEFNEVFKLIYETNRKPLEKVDAEKLEAKLKQPKKELKMFYEYLDEFQLLHKANESISKVLYNNLIASLESLTLKNTDYK